MSLQNGDATAGGIESWSLAEVASLFNRLGEAGTSSS